MKRYLIFKTKSRKSEDYIGDLTLTELDEGINDAIANGTMSLVPVIFKGETIFIMKKLKGLKCGK